MLGIALAASNTPVISAIPNYQNNSINVKKSLFVPKLICHTVADLLINVVVHSCSTVTSVTSGSTVLLLRCLRMIALRTGSARDATKKHQVMGSALQVLEFTDML